MQDRLYFALLKKLFCRAFILPLARNNSIFVLPVRTWHTKNKRLLHCARCVLRLRNGVRFFKMRFVKFVCHCVLRFYVLRFWFMAYTFYVFAFCVLRLWHIRFTFLRFASLLRFAFLPFYVLRFYHTATPAVFVLCLYVLRFLPEVRFLPL